MVNLTQKLKDIIRSHQRKSKTGGALPDASVNALSDPVDREGIVLLDAAAGTLLGPAIMMCNGDKVR